MRLERWRDVTEGWLQSHNVQYKYLIMAPYKTARERRSMGNYGVSKGINYLTATGTSLFIESEPAQAKIIHETSNKPVICISNGRVYQ